MKTPTGIVPLLAHNRQILLGLVGEAIWHPNQIKFFGQFVLPAAYLWVPAVAAILLWIGFRFGS